MDKSGQQLGKCTIHACVFCGYAGHDAKEVALFLERLNAICETWCSAWTVKGNPSISVTRFTIRESFYVGVIIPDPLVDANAAMRELGSVLIAGLGLQKIFRHLDGEEDYLYPPSLEARKLN